MTAAAAAAMTGAQPASAPLLPRLAIHAFCEDDATAGLLRGASADRRLARARFSVQMGGVHIACGAFQMARTPDLIIVESLLGGAEMLADLERLSLVCEPETKVLVIGHVNDVLLYRELRRRGVSDYIVPPFAAGEAADAIAACFSSDPAPAPGRVIAFIGAKGGAGSSTVSHNVGWTLAETMGRAAIIADLDLAFGTAALAFNQDAADTAGQALAMADRLGEGTTEKLLSKCADRLSLLGAAGDLAQSAEIAPEAAARLVDALTSGAADLVLDLPRQWSPWLRQLLAQADEVVITAEPDLASIRNAKNLLDTLAEQRAGGRPAIIVLNKVNVPRRPEISPAEFTAVVGLAPTTVIDFDPALFGTAANNGLMIGEASRKARPAEQFRALAGVLAGKAMAERREHGGGLLAPLLGRLALKRGG